MSMERINGYIDLCKILGIESKNYLENEETFKELTTKIISLPTGLVKVTRMEQLVFRFSLDGEEYYFKFDAYANSYNELLFEEICRDLNIPSISYDLAILGDLKGVVSKNFKQKGAKYISGKEILQILPGFKCQTTLECINENALDNIWAALEYRYQNHPNRVMVVQDIMRKIVKMFILDILTGGGDRNFNNWMIVEYNDGTVDLQPLFDNIRIFIADPDTVRLSMVTETVESEFNKNRLLQECLISFLTHSSEEFVQLFKSSLWVLRKENIENIIKRIEEKTKTPMPKGLVINYKKRAKEYLRFFDKILTFKETPQRKK